MEITSARPTDRAEVLVLLGAQLAEHAIEIPATQLGDSVDGVFAEPSRGALLLARVEGVAVGVAYLSLTWTLEHGGRIGWLEELYVVPDRRERGIGTALLHAVIARARAEGCRALDLEVDAGHTRAAALYLREGFVRLPRTRFTKRLAVS